MSRWILVLSTVALVFSGAATAMVYVTATDETLVDQATLIVYAELGESSIGRDQKGVATRYSARVVEALKGEVKASPLTLRVPGGVSADGRFATLIWGTPKFRPGERALLFLAPELDGTHRILHIAQGAFKESLRGGAATLRRDLTEALELRSSGTSTVMAPGGDAVRDSLKFRSWIRDRARGHERTADYFSAPSGDTGEYVSSFTLLGPANITVRWFRFDRGRKVSWARHTDGQDGLGGRGRAQFRKARRAWNRTQTPIALGDGGTTNSTAGFVVPDGRNTILFEDFNESIGDDFDCAEGGVLAIGGFSDFSAGVQSWKQLGVFEAFEAEIVMNDGVECFVNGQPRIAAQIYAHELGHTLGLGHSCGDFESPDCANSTLLSRAVMRASLSRVVGAKLNDDDRAGARHLYDPEFYAAPCDYAVPGGKAFCRRCGPCGEGQGNCRNDRDCVDNLVCRADPGAEFGFSPTTNVCIDPH